MPRLILAKHSLPRIEPEKLAREWRLSDEGVRRCDALADALAPYQPDTFVSSDEPKAIETAERIAARFGKQNRIVAGLHEHDRRDAGFLSKVEFEAHVAQFFREPRSLVFGRETADQAYARFAKAVDRVITTNADQSVAIVAHGTVISLFVARVAGLNALNVWTRLGLPSFAVWSLPSFKLEEIVNEV